MYYTLVAITPRRNQESVFVSTGEFQAWTVGDT